MASGSLWIVDALVTCGSRSPSSRDIAKLQPVKLHSSGSAAGNNAANSSSGRDQKISCSRRSLLFSAFVVPLLPLGQQARLALAEEQAPERKFRLYEDKMDSYSFEYPASWIKISAGTFRNPTYGDELVSVDLSPPSAYFDSINELTPEEAADKIIKKYLYETTSASSRGILDSKPVILSTSSRTVEGGEVLYDVEVNLKAYRKAPRTTLPASRDPILEWDRRLLGVVGVGNGRLYEMRIQVPEKLMPQEEKSVRQMINSFKIL